MEIHCQRQKSWLGYSVKLIQGVQVEDSICFLRSSSLDDLRKRLTTHHCYPKLKYSKQARKSFKHHLTGQGDKKTKKGRQNAFQLIDWRPSSLRLKNISTWKKAWIIIDYEAFSTMMSSKVSINLTAHGNSCSTSHLKDLNLGPICLEALNHTHMNKSI